MENMKIAILGTRGFPGIQGGIEAHCGNLYVNMLDRDADITVFAREPYVKSGIREYKNLKIIPIPCPKNKYFETTCHTLSGLFAAKKMKTDILHIHAVGPGFFAPLARLMGMKVIMTHHGPDYMRKKWPRPAKAFLKAGEYLGVKYANAVIAISNSIADHIKRTYKREAVYIPNGVIVSAPVASEDVLKKCGLTKGKYILAVGRLVPEKGFHDLIGAFSTVSDEMPGWKLVIAGSADHEDKYSRELTKKAAKNPGIIMTGFLSGIPLQELYSHAGLFVLPSYYEGLPVALLEAMSYGKSCIASDIDSHRELGIKSRRLFKPGDIKELSGKIKYFSGRDLSEKERKYQIDTIKEKYDWAKIAQETLSVYEKVGKTRH